MIKSYNVLLVEDDAIDRMAFERFVINQGLPYSYMIADSLAAARTLLSEHRFDLALVDYALGDGTGLDLIETARDIPIIMITGSSDLEFAVQAMKAGAFDYIVKDPNGNYLTALPITIDNTIERWLAQQELVRYRTRLEQVITERTAAWVEEQMRLQTVVEATPTLVFSLDRQGAFRFIAGNTRDILGYAPEDLINKPFASVLSDPSEIERGLAIAKSGQGFATDLQVNDRWLNLSLSAQYDMSAEADIIGILHDITERKLAEMAVVQERNLLRTLIDNIPDYIFVKDQDGRFVESNLAHNVGARASRTEVINRTASEVFDPSVSAQFHADDELVLKSGRTILNEERITTNKDGDKRYVLTTKVPLYDSKRQNVIGLVGISRDITERRQAEQERLEMERLRIEVENERELVELKQRFVEIASHNFRTPLSIIRTSADLLTNYIEHLSRERQLIKLKQIQDQVDHMVSLLNDVLTLSKLNAGRIDINQKAVDLKVFCERTWENMLDIDTSEHMLSFRYEADVDIIFTDENLLQQILANLLSNAFKYTPNGEAISFTVNSKEDWVVFCIEDEGIGIPDADQKRLFEPFHRASNVRTIEGTGLGLAITRDYVTMQGGTIHVESKENVGTSFIVSLPVNPSQH